LKLTNFTALPVNLGAHVLNFRPDLIKLHGVPVRLVPFQSDGEPQQPGALLFPEIAGDATT
jgi:hypothetical protein